MAEVQADNITDFAGTGGPNFPNGLGNSNSSKTALGQKTYYYNTAYNGGITPAISGAGLTPSIGWFRPFQDSDGNWFLDFGFGGNMSSNASGTINIVGVLFDPAFAQALSNGISGGSIGGASTVPNTSNLTFEFTGAVATLDVSGSVKLGSKPTWAY